MKKLNKHKNDIISVLTLIIISLVIVLILVNFTNFFGSKKDWLSQHIMFPDYLRKLFYDTGDFFPNFAFNLGGGQNIYNISYYGLFNPIILISYLLPFVSMITYIQFSMIVCLIVSIILMYYFLRRRFDSKISFVSTLLFLTAGCFIFHLHRHIMFVDYMPFLLMALIGVDKYFDKKKISLLVISIFLMILTSYYFSVVGLVCVLLYGIFRYIEDKRNDKITVKDFFKEGFKFIFVMLIPVLLSCFLLLPTAYSLLDGRTATNKSILLFELFIPNFDVSNTLYSVYSLGLSAVFIIALIYGVITKKRAVKVISIIFSILFVFPIFDYVFNGGMYLNGKAFIPLLPLAILLIGYFLMNIFNNKSKLKISIIISLIIVVINLLVFVYKREYLCLLFVVDMVLLIIIILIRVRVCEGLYFAFADIMTFAFANIQTFAFANIRIFAYILTFAFANISRNTGFIRIFIGIISIFILIINRDRKLLNINQVWPGKPLPFAFDQLEGFKLLHQFECFGVFTVHVVHQRFDLINDINTPLIIHPAIFLR